MKKNSKIDEKIRINASERQKKLIEEGKLNKFLEWSHKGKYFGIEISNLNYKELTPEKAYILGVLCGDGNINHRQLQLGVIDKDFVEYFTYCVRKTYSKDLTIKEEDNKDRGNINGKIVKNRKKLFKTILSSVKICEDLLRYDYTSTNFNSHTSRIPKEIMNNKDKRVLSMFLRGFYDSEGYISECISKRMIVLSSCNKNLLLDTRELLKRFNIFSSIYSGRRQENEYKLSFSKNLFLLIFYKQIGFSIKRKQERLESNMNSIAKYFKVYNKIKKLNKKYLWSLITLKNYFDNKLPYYYFYNWINGKNNPYDRFCVKTAIKLFP